MQFKSFIVASTIAVSLAAVGLTGCATDVAADDTQADQKALISSGVLSGGYKEPYDTGNGGGCVESNDLIEVNLGIIDLGLNICLLGTCKFPCDENWLDWCSDSWKPCPDAPSDPCPME